MSFSRPSCLQNCALEIWSNCHSHRKKALATINQVEQPADIFSTGNESCKE